MTFLDALTLAASGGDTVARPVAAEPGTGIFLRRGHWTNLVGGYPLLPSPEEMTAEWEVVPFATVLDERRARSEAALRATVRP